ncbi:MAG: phosphoribosylglycinamide formyltransferase [Pseudanabaena sp. ELA607]
MSAANSGTLARPIRLGILASGSGSNMQAIAEAINQGQLAAEIAVVIYNESDAYVKVRAETLQLPTVYLNHRQFKNDATPREALDHALISTLRQYNVDLVVMAGWMRIVTQVLLDGFPERILNIHPSLLPSFRGMHAVEQALNYGVKLAGCTVHVVSLEVDSGQIIQQAAVPVLADDTVTTLQQRIQKAEHQIYPTAIAEYIITNPHL